MISPKITSITFYPHSLSACSSLAVSRCLCLSSGLPYLSLCLQICQLNEQTAPQENFAQCMEERQKKLIIFIWQEKEVQFFSLVLFLLLFCHTKHLYFGCDSRLWVCLLFFLVFIYLNRSISFSSLSNRNILNDKKTSKKKTEELNECSLFEFGLFFIPSKYKK